MPFCPTCKKIKQWLGKQLIKAGIRLSTSDEKPNLILNSYRVEINDNRIKSKFPGRLIIYEATKTKVVLNDEDAVVGI